VMLCHLKKLKWPYHYNRITKQK